MINIVMLEEKRPCQTSWCEHAKYGTCVNFCHHLNRFNVPSSELRFSILNSVAITPNVGKDNAEKHSFYNFLQYPHYV